METVHKNIAALFAGIEKPFEISSVSSRKFVQKVVYLAQNLGLPLNYSFSWYIHGPYSPTLTRDYFELNALEQSGESGSRYKLNDVYLPVATNLRKMIADAPEGVADPDWLELLASIVFLHRESGLPIDAAKTTIAEKKAHVAEYFDSAITRLKEAKLI